MKRLEFKIVCISMVLFSSLSTFVWAKSAPSKKHLSLRPTKASSQEILLQHFKKPSLTKKEIRDLQKRALSFKGKAIPALVKVMKSSDYPEKSRWVATFLVGKIMGKKAAPFLSRFLKHPNWVLRMASLKTLLALKQRRYSTEFRKALGDKSLLVRKQALDNIRKLKLTKEAPHVWAMLYDKKNYYSGKKGSKRANIVRDVVRTIGDLNFEKAKKPLLKMVQKDKYKDIFLEMDYSLQKIMRKKSPKGDFRTKRRYWKKLALMEKTF